ncbi:MAG: ankyrin repeat domain-containing protein [Candidatus Obscuribacterales bacterium]|nr:ankyrin repeat domain-containing protein [Candidatus Obscuribacterales bacterium]
MNSSPNQLNNVLIEALGNSAPGTDTAFLTDLLDRGADVNYEDEGESPLTIAISMGNPEAVKLLHSRGASVRAEHLFVAALNNNLEIAQFLTERGALVQQNREGNALHQAARHGDQPMMSFLLHSAGGKDHIDCFDDLGRTPLMIAVAQNDLQMAKLLLVAGADANALDLDLAGQTALKSAVDNKNADMVMLLLINRADPFLASPGRPSPWDIAKRFRREPHLRIKSLLLPFVPSHLKD